MAYEDKIKEINQKIQEETDNEIIGLYNKILITYTDLQRNPRRYGKHSDQMLAPLYKIESYIQKRKEQLSKEIVKIVNNSKSKLKLIEDPKPAVSDLGELVKIIFKIPLNEDLFFNRIEKIYCISIDDNRKKEVKEIENLLGKEFDYSFSEDVSKNTLEYYLDKNLIHKVYYDRLKSVNRIGPTISFAKIYDDIIKNQYKYSIIFEDDIVWGGKYGNKENLKQTLINELEKIKQLNDDWDIIYLGSESKGNFKVIKNNIVQFDFIDRSSFKDEPLIAEIRFTWGSTPYCGNFGGLHAQIITLNGAKQLLKWFNPAITISDGIVATGILTGTIKHYAFRPSLFKQKDKQYYE